MGGRVRWGVAALLCCGLVWTGIWWACLHPLSPPPLSSDLPGDDCASPSVVDGACGQDAVSTSFLPRPPPSSHTSLLTLVFSACAAFCTPPPKTRSHVLLVYISPQCAPTCWECPPPPPYSLSLPLYIRPRRWGCMDVRMLRVWACARLARRARCDVIRCLSHHRSESAPSIGTPPPSALRQTPITSGSLRGEERMLLLLWGVGEQENRRMWGRECSECAALSKWMRCVACWSKPRYYTPGGGYRCV